MVASTFFTASEREAIAAAVAAAEQRTAAEIVPVLATASDDYHRAEDLVGLGTAFVVLAVAWVELQRVVPAADWDGSADLAIGLPVILILLLAGFGAGVLLARWLPWLKRLALPRRTASARVLIAAHHAFDALHVRRTAAATGVVLYVSLFERQVCVWADRAVSAVVPEAEWRAICDALTTALREGRAAEGFVAAIRRCGDLLAAALPVASGDANELANDLHVLD